jgi:hypothetical protein
VIASRLGSVLPCPPTNSLYSAEQLCPGSYAPLHPTAPVAMPRRHREARRRRGKSHMFINIQCAAAAAARRALSILQYPRPLPGDHPPPNRCRTSGMTNKPPAARAGTDRVQATADGGEDIRWLQGPGRLRRGGVWGGARSRASRRLLQRNLQGQARKQAEGPNGAQAAAAARAAAEPSAAPCPRRSRGGGPAGPGPPRVSR